MNNLRGINNGAVRCWQMLYRCARSSINFLDKKPMATNAYREKPTVMLRPNAKAMVPHRRMGMWCESMLSTSNVWSVLQAQRTFATKAKNFRFDKFGRKIDSTKETALNDNKKREPLPKTRPSKRIASVKSSKRSLRTRDDAKQCTARPLGTVVPVGPENGHLDSALEYSKSKLARKLYLKNKFLLQRKNVPSKRKSFYVKKSTKSMVMPAIKSTKKIENLRMDRNANQNKTERDDLKHLLADLLDKKPKFKTISSNFEYVKASPIFKLMAHNAERRNSLRGKGFQKQLEIPTFFRHPLGQCDHRKISVTRRTTIFPAEKQIEKRTKEALKQKLCLLLQDNNDQDDDVD